MVSYIERMSPTPTEKPTPAELEILKVLWESGEGTVRQVMQTLPGGRAYTTVMTLMDVMHGKKLLRRRRAGKAFIYRPAAERDKTLRAMVTDMIDRAFEGSASSLVAHLLEQARPDEAELEEIRKLIAEQKKSSRRTPRSS